MQKEFVPYEQALELKELGFDEPCFGYYDNIGKLFFNTNGQPVGNDWVWVVPTDAPLYQQAFRWFREVHASYSFIFKFDAGFGYEIFKEGVTQINESFDTYEDAEIECLNCLINLTKITKTNT